MTEVMEFFCIECEMRTLQVLDGNELICEVCDHVTRDEA